MEFDNKLKPKPFRFDRKGAGSMSKKVFSDMEAQMDQGKSFDEALEATAPKQLFRRTSGGKVTSGDPELDNAYEMAYDLAKYGYGFKYFMNYDNIKRLGEEKAKQIWKELISNMEDDYK